MRQHAAAAGTPCRPLANATVDGSGVRSERLPEGLGSGGPQPVIRRGAGTPINHAAASAPPPSLASSGQAIFNFEGESLQAVVEAILGDMRCCSDSI